MSTVREDFALNATRSPNDNKSYHLFTIPENQLQCLLIMGPSKEKSSADDEYQNIFDNADLMREMRRRPTATSTRRTSHARLNFAEQVAAGSRDSINYDFLQTVDLNELQRTGEFKRSKSVSASAARRSKSISMKSVRETKDTPLFSDKKSSFRSRIASTFSRKSRSSAASQGSESEDQDELEAIAAATAAAAMSVDPATRRKTLQWSSSRSILLGPDTRKSVSEDTLSDSNTASSLAAVCMAVGVGSFSDPPELNGLAHFLEHMLSMGSDQYPEEGAFDAFVTKNGGTYNAHTNTEEMVFYFEVREEALNQALDMFSRFFIAPLLTLSAANREIKAIQSELAMYLNDDDFRIGQVWRHTSKPGTPYVNFNIGNEETLSSLLTSIEPMREFFEKYYTGDNMKLAVYSPNSTTDSASLESTVSNLQQQIMEKFEGIRGSRLEKPRDPTTAEEPRINFSECGLPWTSTHLDPAGHTEQEIGGFSIGRVYRIVSPHSGTHRMRFSFPLGPKTSMHDEDVHYHVGYIIGHESTGGILAELKAKGWGTYLAAGMMDGGQFSTTGFRCFVIQTMLTPLGLQEWVQVVGLVFQFIGQVLVKAGPMRKYFEEYHAVQKVAHEYYEEPSSVELVKYCSSYLLPRYRVPNSQLLRARLNTKWQPDAIKRFCRALNPENMRLDICSRLFKRFVKKPPRVGVFPVPSVASAELSATDGAPQGRSPQSKQVRGADHLPNSELASRAAILEPVTQSAFWSDVIPASMMETFKLMYSGKVKLYLRNQIGHDQNTPGLAMPPYNQFVTPVLDLRPFTAHPVTEAMLDLLSGEVAGEEEAKKKQLMWGPKDRVIGFDVKNAAVLVSFQDRERGVAHRWRSANKSAVTAIGNLHKSAKKSKRSSRRKSRSATLVGTSDLYPIEVKLVEDSSTLWQHVEERGSGKFRLVHAPALVSEEEHDSQLRVWMIQDQQHKVPFVGAHVRLVAPRAMGSLQNAVLMDLFVHLVKETVHSELFLAQEAGLVVNLENTDYGVMMKFEGISNSIPMIVEKVISTLLSFGEMLVWKPPSQLEYQTAVEATMLSYNLDGNQGKHAVASLDRTEVHGNLKQMLLTHSYSSWAKAELLRRKKFKFKDFVKFAQPVLKTCFVEALFYGNVDIQHVRPLVDHLLESFRVNKVSPVAKMPKAFPVVAPVCSPGSFSGLMQLGVSQTNGQKVAMHFQLGPQSRQLRLLAMLLYQVIDQPLFHQIRTVEQVGYSISSTQVEYLGMIGFGIQVVSETHTPGQIMDSVDRFLGGFRDTLEGVASEDFLTHKAAVGHMILGHDSGTKATKASAIRSWKMINGESYDWDVVRRDAAALEEVTKEDLLQLYDKLIAPTSSHRRRVTVIVTGQKFPGLRELVVSMAINPKVSVMNGTEPMYCSSLKKLNRRRKKESQKKKGIPQHSAARQAEPQDVSVS